MRPPAEHTYQITKLRSAVFLRPDKDTEVGFARGSISALLAVITKADQPELFNIIRTLFHAFTEEKDFDIQTPPQVWEQIEKFELDEPFWQIVKTAFGYTEESPTLGNFLIRL